MAHFYINTYIFFNIINHMKKVVLRTPHLEFFKYEDFYNFMNRVGGAELVIGGRSEEAIFQVWYLERQEVVVNYHGKHQNPPLLMISLFGSHGGRISKVEKMIEDKLHELRGK